MMPWVRITDRRDQVNHWTDFIEHLFHATTGLPPADQRAFMAALIAEATNLGLSRMTAMCGTVTRGAFAYADMAHVRGHLPRRVSEHAGPLLRASNSAPVGPQTLCVQAEIEHGRLAPLLGHRLDANQILGPAEDIGKGIRHSPTRWSHLPLS